MSLFNSEAEFLKYYFAGDHKEALKFYDSSIDYSSSMYILFSKIFCELEQYDKALQCIDLVEKKVEDEIFVQMAKIERAWIYSLIHQREKAQNLLLEAKNFVDTLLNSQKPLMFFDIILLATLGHVQANLDIEAGNPEITEPYLLEIITHFSDEVQTGAPLLVSNIYGSLGKAYYYIGDISRARQNWNKSLEIQLNIGNKPLIADSYNYLGVCELENGNLKEAEDYLSKSFELALALESTPRLAKLYNNFGYLFQIRYELEIARNFFIKAIESFEKMGDQINKANALNNLAQVELKNGNHSLAKTYLDKVLKLAPSLSHKLIESEALLLSVMVQYETNNSENVEMYLNKLEKINKLEKNTTIANRTQLAKGIHARFSDRIAWQAKAQAIFAKLITEGQVSDDYLTIAYVNLSELLVNELKICTNKQEIISEIIELIEKIQQSASKQSNHALLIITKLHFAQIMIIQNDIEVAYDYINEAIKIAEENGIKKFVEKTKKAKSDLKELVDKWGTVLQENENTIQMLSKESVINYMNEVIKKYDIASL